jgi:hypothetical protein
LILALLLLDRLLPAGAPCLAPSLGLRTEPISALPARVALQALPARVALQALTARVALQALTARVALQALTAGVALQTLHARVALQSLALQRQLVGELVDRNANLLGNGTLDGDLLGELSEHRHDLVCRNVGACLTREGAQERIVCTSPLPQLTLHVGISLSVKGKLLAESLANSLAESKGRLLRLQSRKLRQQALRGIL